MFNTDWSFLLNKKKKNYMTRDTQNSTSNNDNYDFFLFVYKKNYICINIIIIALFLNIFLFISNEVLVFKILLFKFYYYP